MQTIFDFEGDNSPNIVLPEFEEHQRLFAYHLTKMSETFQALTSQPFAGYKQKGILRGFAIDIRDRDGERYLCIGPGMAINARNRLIVLEEEKEIRLVGEITTTPAIFCIFGYYGELENAPEDIDESIDSEALGKFVYYDCKVACVTEQELLANADYVELFRVQTETGTMPLQGLVSPINNLTPYMGEIDLRAVAWLGESGEAFIRPDLQRNFAKQAIHILSQLPISELNFLQAESLTGLISFCRRGLCSRSQFEDAVAYLEADETRNTLELNPVPARPLHDLPNWDLVLYFWELLEMVRGSGKEGPEPPEGHYLSCRQREILVDLDKEKQVEVTLQCDHEKIPFMLSMSLQSNGKIWCEMLPYTTKTSAGDEIVHSWNGRAQNRAIKTFSLPKSLELAAHDRIARTIEQEPFGQCTFERVSPRRNKIILRMPRAKHESKWPGNI